MRNWRTMVGALCIVLAMVLGAFAGFVYARDAGLVGASPTVGARGEDRRLMSAQDEAQNAMAPGDAEQAAADTLPSTASILDSEVIEVTSPEGNAVARRATPDEQREAERQVVTRVFESEHGEITVTAEPKTGTRYSGAGIDAGGPYGGPTTFEGTVIDITVTPLDPTILFFQYDLNNDGKYEIPPQTCGVALGCWTTESTLEDVPFNDDAFGDIVVRGWDGISTIVQLNTGDNLNQATAFQWFLGMFGSTYRNMGYQFKAKVNMQVTQLGHYHYVYTLYNMALWRVSPPTLLGSCLATHVAFQWNWCTLATPVNLVENQDYRIAIRIESWMTGFNHPADTSRVGFGSTYYCFSTTQPNCFISTLWSAAFIPQIDFRWTETKILPDAAVDTAFIEVNNVAPTVFNVVTNPDPGLEGSETQFTADFTDPGLDDTWEVRWIFHDGEVTPWTPITKFNGGAKVLFLHTYAGDGVSLMNAVAGVCGAFCVKMTSIDFGPTGENRVPALSELTPYDVVFVGTNYFHTHSDGIGNLLANYMDQGGGVVMAQGALDNAFGCGAGICGRWDSDLYSPIPRGFIYGSAGSMGTIWVPGHPLLDGVASVGTNGLAGNIFSTNPAATRVVDWNNGRVLGATKLNPIVSNGARAVALNMFPILGYTSGDYLQMITNALRWASQQPDPTIKPMPITLDAVPKIFADDEPTTTTPEDTFPVRVEVRDDDHDRIKVVSSTLLFSTDFELVSQCNGFWPGSSVWPPGWSAQPNTYSWVCGYFGTGGGRGPYILYYYNDQGYGTGNGISDVRTPTFDLSPYVGVRLEYNHYWQGNYPFGTSDGLIQASLDGGASFPVTIADYHWNNPATDRGDRTKENVDVGGFSSVVLRFRYVSNDDWWWFINSFKLTGLVGSIVDGLGTADGTATIANVAPTVIGGFNSALRNEAQSLTFSGFTISDPAILEPTEWFAYAIDHDDGTAVDWNYVGSLAPPKFSVLVVHTVCLGLIGATCADLNDLTSKLLAQDDVGSVTTWDYINYPALPTAPTTSYMLQFDVIIVATNWAYFSYAPFDLARRQVGDNLAAYIDAGRGGAVTMMCVYCTSGGNDLFSIRGRYMDDDYGPYERANYLFPGSSGITILDASDDLFVGVGDGVTASVGSLFIHDAKLRTTVGGGGQAAGRNGVELAQWTADSTSAVGKKVLNNGACTVHFGGFAHTSGSDVGMLLRNMVGCAAGGLPSPRIPTFDYTFGDNGIYTVDFMAVDDDMGFVWDPVANQPRQVLPGVALSHRFVRVAVDNVDPVIAPTTIEAFIAAQVCVRISGTEGNSVTASFFTDGTLSASTTVVRASGSPNPTTEKCGLLKVDVTAPHDFDATLTYSAPSGGSNPTWLVIAPWRDPISPGHGEVTYKYDFASSGASVDQDLSGLKADLIDSGQGAKIDFVAEASDDGSDDLAFLWVFGNTMLSPYAANCAVCTYDINVFHNDGTSRTDGTLASPQFLGFSEPFFDRSANTGRSPLGPTGLTVRDQTVHAFDASQLVYYVIVLVFDDDNTRGYPSSFAPNDGVDMQFVVVDLS